MNNKRLRRSKDKKIGGIAAGIAEFLGIDPIIIRLLFLFSIFLGGVGIFLYIILLIIIPKDYTEITEGKTETEATETAETTDYYTVNDKGEAKKVNKNKGIASTIVGISLIYIGLLFLLRSIIPIFWHKLYFPSLLIFAGILILIIPLITNKKK